MKFFVRKAVLIIILILLTVGMIACQSQNAPENVAPIAPPTASTPQPPQQGQGSPDDPGSSAAVTPSRPLPPEPVEVTSITVILESREVARGTVLEPTVAMRPLDAEDTSYTLSSSDNTVIRRRAGRWTAVGAGTAELIATASNGVAGSITVTVVVIVEDIYLDIDELTIHRGDSITLAPVVLPDDVIDKSVIFTSENDEIATVSEDGTIEALSPGNTMISLSAGNVTKTLSISVIEPVTNISISVTRSIYEVGDQSRFTVSITPDNATDPTFVTSISGSAISMTGETTFSCDAAGEAIITVTASSGVTASQTITVIDREFFANEVFRLTNAERAYAGLPPLAAREHLPEVAQVRANEIIQRFSHDRPDGRSCFTAFEEQDVDYRYAGENLAAGQRTPADAVRGWMNSPGHRENILRSDFGHLGVGVAMDSNGRLYWSQNFTD